MADHEIIKMLKLQAFQNDIKVRISSVNYKYCQYLRSENAYEIKSFKVTDKSLHHAEIPSR